MPLRRGPHRVCDVPIDAALLPEGSDIDELQLASLVTKSVGIEQDLVYSIIARIGLLDRAAGSCSSQ